MDKHVANDYWNPINNTEDIKCCSNCDNELETWDDELTCISCYVCDDCKDWYENCDCISNRDIDQADYNSPEER